MKLVRITLKSNNFFNKAEALSGHHLKVAKPSLPK